MFFYFFLVPKEGFLSVNQNAFRQCLGLIVTFITGLKMAMIAWLEPDPIEEAPA
jgi:hypothetical protein